jgi:hypothetical protein
MAEEKMETEMPAASVANADIVRRNKTLRNLFGAQVQTLQYNALLAEEQLRQEKEEREKLEGQIMQLRTLQATHDVNVEARIKDLQDRLATYKTQDEENNKYVATMLVESLRLNVPPDYQRQLYLHAFFSSPRLYLSIANVKRNEQGKLIFTLVEGPEPTNEVRSLITELGAMDIEEGVKNSLIQELNGLIIKMRTDEVPWSKLERDPVITRAVNDIENDVKKPKTQALILLQNIEVQTMRAEKNWTNIKGILRQKYPNDEDTLILVRLLPNDDYPQDFRLWYIT